jgi:hypothetical protein
VFRRLIRAVVLRSAARKYARYLGARLRKDYGSSDQYSQKQIEASVRRAKLPVENLWFGYAAFMSEAAFLELAPPRSIPRYQELNSMLRRYTQKYSPSGAFEPAPENAYVMTSLPGSPPSLDS